MTRNRNTSGRSFGTGVVIQVWEKAQVIPGQDPNVVRRDRCGAFIRRAMFGENIVSLSSGWEIDHIKPISKGGTDDLTNLQPLQWENNRHKADSYPSWDCFVSTDEEKNKYVNEK